MGYKVDTSAGLGTAAAVGWETGGVLRALVGGNGLKAIGTAAADTGLEACVVGLAVAAATGVALLFKDGFEHHAKQTAQNAATAGVIAGK